METMYERIEKLRKLRKISQGDLEKELGFGNGSISKWKAHDPAPRSVSKLADYFGVTTDYLINGNPGTGKDSTIYNALQLYYKYRESPAQVQYIVQTLLNDTKIEWEFNRKKTDEKEGDSNDT